MDYNIYTTPYFDKELKHLSKHYKSIKSDLVRLINSIKENPCQGVELFPNVRKVRMSITSNNKGKSGGARVIYFMTILTIQEGKIDLVSIYDKSEQSSISKQKIAQLLKSAGLTE
jgi:mRNA-degrading endonuclease RelE of RelBE toxin-antitoxin system